MNKGLIIGRFTQDPEVKQSGEKEYCTFTLAVQRAYKNKNGEYDTDFVPFIAGGKNAQFLTNFFHKGDVAGVEYEVTTRKIKIDDEKSVTAPALNVTSIHFVPGTRRKDNTTAPAAEKSEAKPAKTEAEAVADISDDDDLPF